jgi:hypothetical protein
MNRGLQVTVVVSLLMVVVFVVINPVVDLEPTVLRHLQVSVLLLIAVAFARTFAAYRVTACCHHIVIDNSGSLRKDSLSRIDLTCRRLC